MRKKFDAKLDCLQAMLAFIEKRLQSTKFKGSDIHKVLICSEEILVNIINYAYQKSDKEKKIELECILDNPIEIIIRDNGFPFNPFAEKRAVDVDQLIETRHVGGLGIFITSHVMDNVSYERQNNQNILRMFKFVN